MGIAVLRSRLNLGGGRGLASPEEAAVQERLVKVLAVCALTAAGCKLDLSDGFEDSSDGAQPSSSGIAGFTAPPSNPESMPSFDPRPMIAHSQVAPAPINGGTLL